MPLLKNNVLVPDTWISVETEGELPATGDVVVQATEQAQINSVAAAATATAARLAPHHHHNNNRNHNHPRRRECESECECECEPG